MRDDDRSEDRGVEWSLRLCLCGSGDAGFKEESLLHNAYMSFN